MPSFKNTFGKEETEKNLQYDNTAFLHFSVSLSVALVVLLVFTTLYKLWNDRQSKRVKQARRSGILPRQVQIEAGLRTKRLLSSSVITKLIVVAVLIVVVMLASKTIGEEGSHLKGFDPYELLGVQFDTPPDQIRKAYRYPLKKS